MFDFELIPGLDFEYDAREMAAIYEAVRQTVSKVSGREYVIENFLVGARIMALPVVNTALHAMPIEGFFDVGFYQEAIIYLRMIINQWQQLKVEPRSNLDQIFKRAFPTLAPRVVELLINILRVAEYNLEKVNLLTDIYNQFSQQLNPIYEMTTLMSSGQDVQVLYPYIDQSNLFHLIEMNIKSVPGEISVEVVTHNYQGQVFSKELHSRLSQGLETSFKKFSPSIKFKYATKGSEIFTGQNITNVPIDTRTVFFMHFVRYMLLNPDETYKKPSLSPTTKGLNEREIDLQFLDRHQQLSSHRARLSLHEKSVYARYFINTSAASIFGLLNALFEMAEFSVGLGAFSRAKHIYSRITFLIRQYSFNSPTKEFLTADAKSAAEKAMLELKRRASDNDVRDINLETKLMPVSKNALLATSYEQRLDGLNRKIQSCLLGVPDKLAKIILQLRNVVNVSSDEKFREVISNLILKIRRPESFCNLDLLLIQKPTERSNTGPKLPFAFVGANSTKKIITEIKTLPDLLRDIQTVKKTVSDPEEVTQDEKSKEALALLDSLYGYYHNFLKEFETADVSTRTTMASQNISVVLPGGVTDFIEANDNRLFQIDDTGNLVKRAGPGQSAIFYFNGLFSKGINTSAPSGPGFQIAHDKLFRKLFNAQTAVTQVMLLSHPKGFSYLLQLSEEIKGTLLQDWLANGNDLKKLDFESFAVCAFMSMTTQPGDAKPDNFIVVEKEGKNKVVYFDTDIYGKGSIEKVKDGMHFSMIKSVMYCMPQMSQKVPESLRHRLITLCPETLILDWLEEILLQNEKYGQMLSYFPPESVVSLKNKLIVKYDLNFIFAFYYSLVGLIDELKLNPEITLQQLFQKVDPVTYEIYQNANSIFNTGQTGTDIVNRIRYIYGNHRDFARKSVEETIPPHHRFVNGATLEEVLQKELGVVDRAGSKELLLPERLIEGFVNSINFSLCDLENIGAIFERLTSFAPRFKSLTLRHIELVSVEKVVMVLKAAVQLKELNIVGRHSLSSGDIQRVLSDNPELNLALTLTSPGAIQVYRSMAASHRGKFSFLTVTESRVLQPSFYQYHWINYPLQYLLENLGLPSAASYVLQNSENDINALHSKRGQGIAHALVHRMNEYLGLNEVFGSNSTPGIKDSDDTVNRLLTLTQDSKNSSSKTQDLSSEESGVQVIKLYQHYIFSWFITLKIYGVDINLLNTSGQAPIHMTAEFGIPNLMTFLLEEMNANVRLQTAGLNENIFHIAVRKKHIELLKILFEKLDTETIATLTSEQFNLNGEAPVHAAVRDYAIFAVFLKYEKKGVNFGVLSFSKLIPLHYVLMEKIVPGTFDESQKSAIVKQLLLLGHDGTGKELSELPADTAKRCAPELVEEINGHYERKHDDFDKRTHRPNLQTMELNQDDSLKKQYEYLFARAEEFRVQSEDSLKDISFRMERAIQAISCLVSGMKIAEQVLSYNNKIPVCEDKIDKIIKKFVSIYGDFQAVSFSNSCKFFQEARKEMIRIWLASYNMQGSNNGRTVAEESSRKLKQLLAKSIDANMTLLGKPPVNYAIYILGPLVRERVDIFSNVALGFVFEEKPNTKSMEYFQCLSFLLRTNFLRTGEAGDIFVQLSNGDQQGIAFSNQKFGMRMESNELFPSGKTSFSLPMGSPKDVAGYMQSPELWRIWSDFNTASLLRVDDRSFGTEALIEQLKKKFSESLSWSAVALDYIHAIIEEFRQEIFTQTNIKGVLDLNHIYFRFPFLLVEQLCVFFKVSERGFFDNLQSLMAEGYLSKEMVSSLTEVLSRWIVFSTRVKNFYQEDKTIVVLNPESILEKNMFSKTGLYECNAGDISDIKEFLSISYVLYRAAITFVTNKPKVFYVLNPSAPKLKNPAMVFSEMIVSKYERSVSIEEKADPEIFVLYGIEYLMAEKYRELENVVRMLTDMMAQQSFPKELKKEALYLQVSYLRGAKHYHASIKILDTLINHIKSELSGESLNKLYEGNADKKSDRKSIGPETASLSRVSNISLAFPLHLLAHSLLHVDLFQSAMNAVVETLKINKKKALSVLGQAKALLLAIKILNQMGRSNESQPYFNELLGLMPKIERKYFGLFGEIARSNASFVIEQPSFSDNLRMELTQQLMLKASYHDLCLFGDNTQSALSNAVIFYKLADLLSQRSVSAKIFARIKYLTDILSRQDILISLLLNAHRQLKVNKANEEHLQQAISLYEETKDQMTYFAEGELLMISGFSEYAQTADTRNLKRAKMLFELLLSTLNSRLSRLESVRQQLQSSTLLIDISKTQSKIEDQIIVMLKLIINVKMKLACDEILRGQFCQLFDLLKKRAAYQDIMQYLNSYVDIHGYLDSPMNYQVILHAAQLYFECISVLQKELLAHPYADTVKKNIDGNNLVAIPSTIGMAMSLPNQVAVDAQDAATYHKVIGALNKVFTDFLATSTSEKIVSGINLTDYQNISRIAYTYLNTPQRALAIVLIKFLSENVYREVLKFTQNETASARQSPNPFRGNNSQCFFQKRAGSRTMQFDIGWETTFAQAFPELNRVEVRNKVVRFLTDKAVEQDLVNKLTNWINQNFRIVPRDIGINSEGGVTVVFMTDETASSFLHTLIFPELYKSGISVSWSHDNNPSPTTSVRQPVQPTVPAPLSPTIQVLRVAPQVAVQPSAQPVVQASNVQSSTSRGSQLSQSFGNISLNRLPPPPRANFLGGAASNSSSAISPRTLPSTSVPNNSASLPLQPNDTVVPTAGVSTPSPRALPNAPVPNNSAGLPSQPNNKAISTTSVSTPSPRALPSAPVPNNAAGLPPRPSNMVIPTASVATPSRSLGRQPGPTGAA